MQPNFYHPANEFKGSRTCLPVHGICEWAECVANIELFIDVHRGVGQNPGSCHGLLTLAEILPGGRRFRQPQ